MYEFWHYSGFNNIIVIFLQVFLLGREARECAKIGKNLFHAIYSLLAKVEFYTRKSFLEQNIAKMWYTKRQVRKQDPDISRKLQFRSKSWKYVLGGLLPLTPICGEISLTPFMLQQLSSIFFLCGEVIYSFLPNLPWFLQADLTCPQI